MSLLFLSARRATLNCRALNVSNGCPRTETLIALMIVFKKSPRELIPDAYDRLLKLIHLRATELHEELQGDSKQITKQKLDTLEAMLTDERDNSQAI